MSDLTIDHDEKKDGYKVTLPCRPEEFTDFVSSLLGKGLTIEKNYDDVFKLDSQALQQLHILILQRANQNQGQLVSYHSKLYFDDKSSISFNSPEDLFSHNEIKKVGTISLSIEMVFLIHFPGRPSPEKQSISFVLKTGGVTQRTSRYIYIDNSEINLQISHTEKTWANDVLNLISDFLTHHTYKPNKTTLLWNAVSDKVGLISGFLCFGIGLLGIVFGYDFLAEELALTANAASLTEKEMLGFLVSQEASSTFVKFTIASIFYIAVLIAVSVYVAEYIKDLNQIGIRSRLIFTAEDTRRLDGAEKTSNIQLLGLSIELLKGIFVGICANVIFTSIWS